VNVELVLFGAFALLTLLSAGMVIFAKSAISSAMSLVATFFFLAGIYVLLWAHTVAVLQVLVYAGAIMVLFCSSSCCSTWARRRRPDHG